MENVAAKNTKCAKKAWPMVRLRNVCEINLGKTPPRGSRDCWDSEKSSGNVWVSISDMSNLIGGKIEDSKEYITRYAIESVGVPVVSKGTLLLSFKLTLGRTAIAGCDLYTNEAIAALPVKNDFKGQIDVPFLVTYFSFFDWNGFAAKDEKLLGKTLNKKKLAEIPVPLPPLTVQREIVARLEKELGEADALAAKFKEIAENADAEFKAELDETFKNVEGEKVRLGEICEAINVGIVVKPTRYYVDDGEGIPAFRNLNVKPSYVDESEWVYVSESAGEENPRSVVKIGDVLIARSGVPGAAVAIDSLKLNGRIAIDILVVVPKQSMVNSKYLAWEINTSKCQAEIRNMNNGVALAHIGVKSISKLEIVIPSLPAQRAIVGKLDSAKDKCEKLKAAAERGVRAAEDLRKAILAEAFEQ